MLVAITGLFLFTGCKGKIETVYELGGDLCVFDEGNDPTGTSFQVLQGDKKKFLAVVYDRCASGCVNIQSSSCSAKVDGDRILLQSQVKTVVITRAGGTDCPAECVVLKSECPIEGELLPGRQYTVSNGAASLTFQVPGTVQCRALQPGEKPNGSTGPMSGDSGTSSAASGTGIQSSATTSSLP